MKSPCIRICKLNENQVCIGCGRTWEQVRDWSIYTDKQRDDVIKSLKYFRSQRKTKYD